MFLLSQSEPQLVFNPQQNSPVIRKHLWMNAEELQGDTEAHLIKIIFVSAQCGEGVSMQWSHQELPSQP